MRVYYSDTRCYPFFAPLLPVLKATTWTELDYGWPTYRWIQCRTLRTAGKPYVLDTHNLHWAYYERRAHEHRNVVLSMLYKRDAAVLKSYELSGFKRAAMGLVCSEDEQAAVHDIDASSPIHVVPNGVDCQECDRGDTDTFANASELIFVGDMAYPTNNGGVLEFIRETFPQVAKQVPDLHLAVVGCRPSPELLLETDG